MKGQFEPQARTGGSTIAPHMLQRKCACGAHTPGGGTCRSCAGNQTGIQRDGADGQAQGAVPDIVHQVLRSPGQPLDSATRNFMEPRFGQDFSGVRVHNGEAAAAAARAVDAYAFTAGRNIVFDRSRYSPATVEGRSLLAHELTHAVQQRLASSPSPETQYTSVGADPSLEHEADRVAANVISARPAGPISSKGTQAARFAIARANQDAVGYVMRLGQSAHTGIQFWPVNVVDTVVGPVSAQGGLLSSGADRLNAILGQNMTLNHLGAQLLPLWTTATPFTPPGAAAPLPLDIITADELARALLVYNQYYLPVPAMTNWRAGLRFPLPVDIDPATGIATVHPLQIRALAGAFDPAWTPLLERAVAATVAPAPAVLQADVTAFLGAQPTAMARGIQLGARAVTNAVAERPFVREVFSQLGAAGFDVALAFMDNLVNNEIALLASQADGAAILAEARTALGLAPAVLTQAQQDSVARANTMFALVAGAVARPATTAARTRADKMITVDTVKLDGSTHDPATQVREADAIFSQCDVRVAHGIDATATPAQTTGWLGGNTDIRSNNNSASPSTEERALITGASATFGLGARFRAFFATSVTGVNGCGYSFDQATGLLRNRVFVLNCGDTATLAHELGHVLTRVPAHPAAGLMSGRPAAPAMRVPSITDSQCTNLYNNA